MWSNAVAYLLLKKEMIYNETSITIIL